MHDVKIHDVTMLQSAVRTLSFCLASLTSILYLFLIILLFFSIYLYYKNSDTYSNRSQCCWTIYAAQPIKFENPSACLYTEAHVKSIQ